MPNTPVTWLDQFIVNTTVSGVQSDPDIAQLANGNLVVSWTTTDPGGEGSPNGAETFAQIFDPGGNRIGAEFRLNNASLSGDEQNADLAPLPGGGFIVAYHDLNNPASVPAGASNIRIEEYDANGGPVPENSLVINDSLNGSDPNYRAPRIAAFSSALVVYEEFTAAGVKIAGKIYNPLGDVYGFQIGLISGSGDVNAAPDVAALNNGNYVIATTYNVSGDNAINYAIVNSIGGSVRAPTFIPNTNTDGLNDREVSLVALVGGGFVIAWTNTDSSDTDLFFRVYDNNGDQIGFGTPGNTSESNNNSNPKVIALVDGTFVVAWDNDETNGVNARHYNAMGASLGDAFIVSADNPISLSGVGLGDGRFALVWRSGGGEIAMEILDTRDAPNSPAAYAPDQWIVGVNGPDVITLGAATENASGGLGGDSITGNASANNLLGDGGDDVLTGLGGFDILTGGPGRDTAQYAAAAQPVVVFLDGSNAVIVTINGAIEDAIREIENVNGGSGGDSLVGDSSANTLNGNGGHDFLFSNGFNPDGTMKSGAGNDTLDGGAGDDGLFGGDGVDTLDGGAGGDGLVGGAGVDTLNGGTGGDFLFGGFFTTGGGFAPGSGVDTLNGGDGNDGLYGFDGSDTINGDSGDDYVEGGFGVDTIDGGAGNDFLLGQDGVDTITGGSGFDYEYGGAGADTFIFRADDSADWILDFSAAQGDKLVLDGFGFANFAAIPFVDLSTPASPAVQLTVASSGGTDQLTIFGVTLAQLNAANVLVV